jgi:rubrerythrin
MPGTGRTLQLRTQESPRGNRVKPLTARALDARDITMREYKCNLCGHVGWRFDDEPRFCPECKENVGFSEMSATGREDENPFEPRQVAEW